MKKEHGNDEQEEQHEAVNLSKESKAPKESTSSESVHLLDVHAREADVESPKYRIANRATPGWVWGLLGALVAGLICFLVFGRDGGETVIVPPVASVPPAATPVVIQPVNPTPKNIGKVAKRPCRGIAGEKIITDDCMRFRAKQMSGDNDERYQAIVGSN